MADSEKEGRLLSSVFSLLPIGSELTLIYLLEYLLRLIILFQTVRPK